MTTEVAPPGATGAAARGPAAGAATGPAGGSATRRAAGPVGGSATGSVVRPVVGRDRDIAELLALLGEPGIRGVQLHGGPGIGKSRLAEAAAAQVRGRVLNWLPMARMDPVQALIRQLAGGPADRPEDVPEPLDLLVLDGLDALGPEGLRELLDAALRYAARVLLTVRYPVAVPGLREFRVAALPVPLDCSALDLAGLAGVPSVRLFTERLRELHPGFLLDDANQHLVARICAGLRGVPGALCRAARVAATEGLEVFATAVDENAPLPLTDLAALIDSYGDAGPDSPVTVADLPPDALRLLCLARVFTGGFGAEALRALTGPDGSAPGGGYGHPGPESGGPEVPGPKGGAGTGGSGRRERPGGDGAHSTQGTDRPRRIGYRALEPLRARHLLAVSPLPSGTLDGLARVRMHLPPAALAATRAVLPDLTRARQAHARYYAELAGAAARRIRGGDQHGGIAAFHAEEPNIGAALSTLLAAGDHRQAVQLVESACHFWRATGAPFVWAEQLAAADGQDPDDPAAARAALIRAEARARSGEPEAARLQMARAERAATADPAVAARLLHLRALIEPPGRLGAAVGLLRQSVARWREAGDQHAAAHVLLDLAAAHFHAGDREAAVRPAQKVVADAVSRGDVLNSGTALLQLSAYAAGSGPEAEEYFHRAMAGLRGLGAAAVLGSFVRVVASPMRPGASARALSTVRLLGGFHASREDMLGTAAVPDFAVSRLEQRLRRLLGDHDFTQALREGAATPLYDQITRAGGGQDAVPPPVALAPHHPRTTYATGTATGRPDPATTSFGGVLTARQSEVCELVAEGMSNKQIAHRLQISEWTVVNHMREIMRKLDCTSRVGVAGRVLSLRPA
ncbi:LuxR family transcriptional regulator [Actinacidiphila sp. ITFR-21]|uniref:LuxR family transcriptional regulator n=1 Tax=Actinacidiphila sp. ITFR-21 TaxID=3075199 RepID=UPI00288B65C6|nr:LuxR family transcriptional regulator [Streptomyces sp. ITFR-21]WNI17345.1 LuxR family transcriptional regulator [Streptomyces sp. ITFR-21]